MRGLADSIAQLNAMARKPSAAQPDNTPPLTELVGFGSNPGQLRAFQYVPHKLPAGAALVVVLHGCSQSAAGYDQGAGWSRLAEDHGFALLLPEQQRRNNLNGCFNWFEPSDTLRGSGEALSIRQMIAAIQAHHSVDPARIFITGLSAGGAMTSSMLAAYPELFAGGAIIGGLPHGVAAGMMEALDRMRGRGLPDGDGLAAKIAGSSDYVGTWPTISVWHGDADTTVNVANAAAIALQWRRIHGLADEPHAIEAVDGVKRRVWRTKEDRVALDEYIVPGMGHGTPLKLSGPSPYGAAAPYMLDVGISSTVRMAETWGLVGASRVRSERAAAGMRSTLPSVERKIARRSSRVPIAPETGSAPQTGVAQPITDALRAAGLLR